MGQAMRKARGSTYSTECVWAYSKGAHTHTVGTECTMWEMGIQDIMDMRDADIHLHENAWIHGWAHVHRGGAEHATWDAVQRTVQHMGCMEYVVQGAQCT